MNKNTGFSIIEIVIAAAIIVTLVTAAAGAWQLYFKVSRTSNQNTQAALLTGEAAEALNLLRDSGWTANISPLSLGTTYYLYWNGDTYATSTTPILIDNSPYSISFVFSEIRRDTTSDNIVSSGGAVDIHTRSVVISIMSSSSPPMTVMQSSLLLHDVYKN